MGEAGDRDGERLIPGYGPVGPLGPLDNTSKLEIDQIKSNLTD